MLYQYKCHSHVKIWLSNNSTVFMNFENQTRLIDMREKNPNDLIHLIYDSTLLNASALLELNDFCKENNIIPVDADGFKDQLQLESERILYEFYKDEINHLSDGGNLGVASDILRWLSASYRLGTYTDLDVPLNTQHLPETVSVSSPLLLNIGSLKLLGKKEMVIALNEYIAVIDEEAAGEQIKRVQQGLIRKLRHYSSDYIEKTEVMLSQGHFLNRILIGYIKNRAESLYIKKSTELKPSNGVSTSRGLRAYINEIMTDSKLYLDFNSNLQETHEDVIKRLRNELQSQLGIIKWLFFTKDYYEIKKVLVQNDDQFITYMMKKERSLYLKSLVICTTGPIEVGNSLFGTYVMDSVEVNRRVKPITFSHYNLHNAFLSRNVIPLHEDPLSMLRFLAADVGELNDSSWLEEGMSLQKKRQELLLQKQQKIVADLPSELTRIKKNIKDHIVILEKNSKGFFSFLWQSRRDIKIQALNKVLTCFDNETKTFDLAQFQGLLADDSLNWKNVFAGFFFKRTQYLIKGLELLCNDALVYRAIKNKKISMPITEHSSSTLLLPEVFGELKTNEKLQSKYESLNNLEDKGCFYPVKESEHHVNRACSFGRFFASSDCSKSKKLELDSNYGHSSSPVAG